MCKAKLASLSGALALATLVGCGDEKAPSCRVAQAPTLTGNALTASRDAWLHRVGSDFVLVGLEGDTVRWARLSTAGALGAVSELTLPTPRALRPAPWFGLVGRNNPGDQLVVAYVAAKDGGAGQTPLPHEIRIITQGAGEAAVAPRALTDLPAGVDPGIIRLAMGTSRTGLRAVLAVGFEGQTASPTAYVFGADGALVGEPLTLFTKGSLLPWRCLDVVASRTDFAVSLVESEGSGQARPGWRIFELKDDGGRGFQYSMSFTVSGIDCPAVSPTPAGYAVIYQNLDGTFFSEFDVAKTLINSDIVVGALRFGGSHRQPRAAAVAPMGRDFGLLFERASGHELWRFNAFGVPQGGPTLLPAVRGRVGPVSAWPGQDQVFATYLDEPARPTMQSDGNSSGSQRHLIQLDCPAALQLPPAADAGK